MPSVLHRAPWQQPALPLRTPRLPIPNFSRFWGHAASRSGDPAQQKLTLQNAAPKPALFPWVQKPQAHPWEGQKERPWGSATTLGTGTHWDAWGSSWPKSQGRAPQRLPPRRELHPLSTIPSCSQGLQRKELEPDQTQPENTNTYGEMPRAFPRKRLLWKRRWRGPADLAGRRQWDCGGRCCSTSSPRLPAAGRAPASLTRPRLCPLLHFCSQALHVFCLQTGLGGGDALLGAGSRGSSPGTAPAWWAQLHWDQRHWDWLGTRGMVKTRLAPALRISLERLQEQVQVP